MQQATTSRDRIRIRVYTAPETTQISLSRNGALTNCEEEQEEGHEQGTVMEISTDKKSPTKALSLGRINMT